MLFAVHLDALAQSRGVRAFAVHPGFILTNLLRYMSRQDQLDAGPNPLLHPFPRGLQPIAG